MGKFTTLADIYGEKAPDNRPALELWHAHQPGFGVRILKPQLRPAIKPGGKPREVVRRVWLCRYQVEDEHGKKKDRKEPLGVIERIDDSDTVLSLDDALREAQRRRAPYKNASGSVRRWTVRRAYDEVVKRARGASPATLQAEADIRHAYFGGIEDRYLDELDDSFWSTDFVQALQMGDFAAVDKNGKAVKRRLSETRLRVVLTSASKLYTLAHKNNALRGGMPADWNPPRDNKSLLSLPRVRTGHVPTKMFSAFWDALDFHGSTEARDILRVTVLTGLRKSLVLAMTWEQLDLNAGLLTIPPYQKGTKLHRSNKQNAVPFEVPLSKQVVDIIKRRKRMAGDSPWVFYSPTDGKRHIMDPSDSLERVASVIGLKGLTLHDLRRTFSTLANAARCDGIVVGHLMLHSAAQIAADTRVTETTVNYTRVSLELKREVTQAISDYAMKLIAEGEQAAAAAEAA